MFARRQSMPSNVTVPPCGTSPEIARNVEVFPAPLGPINATTSPLVTSRSMPRTAEHRPVGHLELTDLQHDQSTSATPR